MIILLSALAAAQDLSLLTVGTPSPEVVITCQPTRAVLSLLQALPPMPVGGASLQALMADASAHGIDLDGRVSAAQWRSTGAGRVVVGFEGDQARVDALVASLSERPEEVDARLVDGQLVFSDPEVPAGEGGAIPDIIAGLPDESACIVGIDGMDLEKAPITGVAISMPLGGGEELAVRLRMKEDTLPPMGVDGPPIGGRSSQRPIGVIVLGSAPLSIFSHPPVMEALEITADELAAVTDRLVPAPGMTMAIFGDPQQPTYAWSMGINDAKGAPLSRRKMMRYTRKFLKNDGHAYERIGRDRLRVSVDDELPILVAMEEGRVVFGTAQTAVGETIDGGGSDWVTADLSAQAAQWPIAAVIDPPQLPAAARIGARLSGDQVEASLQIEGLAGLMQTAMAMAPMAMQQMQAGVQTSQVSDDLDAFLAAQHAHRESAGGWQAVARGEPWASFSPEVEAATYWAVAAPGGKLELHAEIDADGDGVPAHYMLDDDERFWTLSPDGVK